MIPVHLEGTRKILARGATRLKPGTTHITFGRPLLPVGNPRELAVKVESTIAALGDERTTDLVDRSSQSGACRNDPELAGTRQRRLAPYLGPGGTGPVPASPTVAPACS